MSASIKTSLLGQEITTEQIHEFFDKIMEKLANDKQSMLIGTATEEQAAMYERMIKGDFRKVAETIWKGESRLILQEMFSDYIQGITKSKQLPKQLAFSFRNASMNVFVVINDDDDELAHSIILTESLLVSKYYEKGFKINTTIVEEFEKASIPNGYALFPFQKKFVVASKK